MLQKINQKTKKFIPFYAWSAFLIIVGVHSAITIIKAELHLHPKIFIMSLIVWHIFTGVGLILRRKWSYYSLQVILALVFFAFPVGTILAYKTNAFIKKNNARAFFY
jgi:hypothetical protein